MGGEEEGTAMRRSSVIAAALVAGQAVAAETQHRKLAQGIDEGSISYEVLVSAAENVLGDNFLGGGIDAGDFAGDVIGPLLAAPAAASGRASRSSCGPCTRFSSRSLAWASATRFAPP